MPIALRSLIDDIASRADEFLAGASARRHARAGSEEFLTLEYGALAPATRQAVVDGVMAVLEDEDFFGTEFVGDAFGGDNRERDE